MSKDTIVRFVSPRYRSLKLVMEPGYSKEVGGRVLAVAGKSVRFADGVYETTDPAEIEFLRGHDNNVANSTKARKSPLFEEVDLEDIEEKLASQKSLEQREADIAAREKAVADKEAKLARKAPSKSDKKDSKSKPSSDKKQAY